jgi:D-glycerate 3-kinase
MTRLHSANYCARRTTINWPIGMHNDALQLVEESVQAWLASAGDQPLVVGLCGAQGSGKSTLATSLIRRFAARGVPGAALSLDDLYLTRSERSRLAREVHPLLATRGPPGTHDIALGLSVIEAVMAGRPVLLPKFDKGTDDRAPRGAWEHAPAGTRLLILEGWCVGARPQPAATLREPVNALECDEDQDGAWRRYVNQLLAGDYQQLFARVDRLVLLAAPGFEVVERWRGQQEAQLRRATLSSSSVVMDDAGLHRFIQHYERLTRHILGEMPSRADLVIELSADRQMTGFAAR